MSPASSVLVVCTANVCRSPSGGLLLQPPGGGSALAVTTAGTRSTAGARYCPLAAGLLGGTAVDLLDGHRSRALSREDLERADLVLVMERRHRSSVAALLPGAATRTFTLREAAHLADAPGPLSVAGGELATVVSALNAARGTLPTPEVPTAGWSARLRRRPPVHPFDIPDPHTDDHTSHEAALELVASSVARVRALLGLG